jgi:hypothetical protein
MSEQGVFHFVGAGEWLQSICRDYGVRNPARVWDHAENAKVKKARKPHALHPGDALFIPEPRAKNESCGDKAKHTFVVRSFTEDFTLTLQEPDGSAMKNVKYRLVLGGYEFNASTDGDGKLEHKELVLRSGDQGVLEIPDRGLRYPIALGALNPGEKAGGDEGHYDDGVSGLRQRLNNLGFFAGTSSGRPDEVGVTQDDPLVGAVAEFQRVVMGKPAKEATGELNDETRQAIIDAFGA